MLSIREKIAESYFGFSLLEYYQKQYNRVELVRGTKDIFKLSNFDISNKLKSNEVEILWRVSQFTPSNKRNCLLMLDSSNRIIDYSVDSRLVVATGDYCGVDILRFKSSGGSSGVGSSWRFFEAGDFSKCINSLGVEEYYSGVAALNLGGELERKFNMKESYIITVSYVMCRDIFKKSFNSYLI